VAGPTLVRLDAQAKGYPLATFDCAPRPEACVDLPPGATLVLFTDGLVERPGESIDTGIDAVAALLGDAAQRIPEEVCDLVLNARRPAPGYDDDVAMVVYRQPPAPLRLDVPADATQLVEIRRRLQRWLSAAGIAGHAADDAVMAVNEACTNSIEHGYHGADVDRRPRRVRLRAAVDATHVTLTVVDAGTWLPAQVAASGRGRGIAMMRAVGDSFHIERTAVGTVVRLRIDLAGSRTAASQPWQSRGMAAEMSRPARSTDPLTTTVTSRHNVTVLSVAGAIDLATASLLENAITAALALGDTRGFVVDLTEVDFLASVGMAILVTTHQRVDARGGTFAIVAHGPATSRPLALTGLDRVLTIHPTLSAALAE